MAGAPRDMAAVATRNATQGSCIADQALRSCSPVYMNADAASSCWACARSRAGKTAATKSDHGEGSEVCIIKDGCNLLQSMVPTRTCFVRVSHVLLPC